MNRSFGFLPPEHDCNPTQLGPMVQPLQVQADNFEEYLVVPGLTVQGVFNLPVTVSPWPLVPSGLPITLWYNVTSPTTSVAGEAIWVPHSLCFLCMGVWSVSVVVQRSEVEGG